MKWFLCFVALAVGCAEESRHTWWVEDADTGERIGPFAYDVDAQQWVTDWKREREEFNRTTPSYESAQPPQTIEGNGFTIEMGRPTFRAYRFDRDLRVVRE